MTARSGSSSEDTAPQDPSQSSPHEVHEETVMTDEGQSSQSDLQKLQERLEQSEERTRHLEALLQQALEKTNGLSLQSENQRSGKEPHQPPTSQVDANLVPPASATQVPTHQPIQPPSQVLPLAAAATPIPTTSSGIPANGQCVSTTPVPPCPVWPSQQFQLPGSQAGNSSNTGYYPANFMPYMMPPWFYPWAG